MALPIHNVAIVGASGPLGRSILAGLQAAVPPFNITIISRVSSTSTFPNLTTHKLSNTLPESELVTAFQGQDAVICLLPGRLAQEQYRIIDAAVAAGVKRFVPSNFSLNDTFKPLQELIWTSKIKGDVIDYLKTKEDVGMSWTGIAMGHWIDWGLERSFFGIGLKNKKAEFWDEGIVKFSSSALSTAGIAVARVLQLPDETANEFLYIRDFTLSQQDVVATLEKLTGQKWERKYVNSGERIKDGKERIRSGDVTGVHELIKSAFLVEGLRMDFEKGEALANEMLGLPVVRLEDVVREILHRHEFIS